MDIFNTMTDQNNTTQKKELFRIAICGSVDDGKSTLIGRLFHDCDAIFQDHLQAIQKTSAKKGMQEIDFSLLTDGLSAEREQGITIDVAYKYLDTVAKRIIIADVPGHEQYTRNMATGASTADMVVILLDAHRGVTKQSKRHAYVASLLGIKHIVVCVNKMDAVQYEKKVFEEIVNEFTTYLKGITVQQVDVIPVSALKGDMIVQRGEHLNWYAGKTIYEVFTETSAVENNDALRVPIQTVIRTKDFRGYAGRVYGGSIAKGDSVMILPSKQEAHVTSLAIGEHMQDVVETYQSVTLTLDKDIDVSRGDMIVHSENQPHIGNTFTARIFWLSEHHVDIQKTYFIKQESKKGRCTINTILHGINIDTGKQESIEKLETNEVAEVTLTTNDTCVFDTYVQNKYTGSFILIDEVSGDTVGAGIIM